MASIVQRSNRYNVVYLYDDEATGKRKQKWESFSTLVSVGSSRPRFVGSNEPLFVGKPEANR